MVLGKNFMYRLRITLNLMAMDMVRLAKEELWVEVTHPQCRRAKEWAIKCIKGRVEFEVEKL